MRLERKAGFGAQAMPAIPISRCRNPADGKLHSPNFDVIFKGLFSKLGLLHIKLPLGGGDQPPLFFLEKGPNVVKKKWFKSSKTALDPAECRFVAFWYQADGCLAGHLDPHLQGVPASKLSRQQTLFKNYQLEFLISGVARSQTETNATRYCTSCVGGESHPRCHCKVQTKDPVLEASSIGTSRRMQANRRSAARLSHFSPSWGVHGIRTTPKSSPGKSATARIRNNPGGGGCPPGPKSPTLGCLRGTGPNEYTKTTFQPETRKPGLPHGQGIE